MGSQKNSGADEPVVAGLEPEDTASNQEAVPIPYLAGEVRMKGIQIAPLYNKTKWETVPASNPGGGGK